MSSSSDSEEEATPQERRTLDARCQLCQEEFLAAGIARFWETLQKHVGAAPPEGGDEEAGPSSARVGEQQFLLQGGVSVAHTDFLSQFYERLRLNSVQFSKGLCGRDKQTLLKQEGPSEADLHRLLNNVRALRRINDCLFEQAETSALHMCQSARLTAQEHLQKRLRHLSTANLRCLSAIAASVSFGTEAETDLLALVAATHSMGDRLRILQAEAKQLNHQARSVRSNPQKKAALLPKQIEIDCCIANLNDALRGAKRSLLQALQELGRLAETADDAANLFIITRELVDSARSVRSELYEPKNVAFADRSMRLWDVEECVTAAKSALELAAGLARQLATPDEKQRGSMSDNCVNAIKGFVFKVADEQLGVRGWIVSPDAIKAEINHNLNTHG